MASEMIKLLLIEDNPYDAKVIRLMLVSQRRLLPTDVPFELHDASTLNDGLHHLHDHRPDLVILDLNLPDSDGLDTFLQVNAENSAVPVIIISATDDLQLAVEAVQSGAQDYLLKGEMSRNLLVRAIHHALERQAIRRELDQRTRELAASEARLRMITDKSADGIVIANDAGVVRFANPAARRLLDLSDDPATEQRLPFSISADEVTEITPSAADTDETVTVEVHTVSTEWGTESAQLVVMRDITDRKRAEQALQSANDNLENVVKARTSELKKANEYLLDQISERRRAQRALNRALTEAEQARDQLDTIVASVADGLLATDTHNRITMMNRAAEELLEVEGSDAIGQPIERVINHPTLIERILATLETGRELQFEFEMPPRFGESPNDNRTKTIRARSAVVKDRAKNGGGIITVMVDVTREREVDRLKAEFISTAAHELRTPLTTVQGFSEILLARDNLPLETRHKYLSYINNQALALARIVDDLLNLAKIESGRKFALNKEPVQIGVLVEPVVQKFAADNPIHKFQVQLQDTTVAWVVDRQKMTQVLENLLGNAVKFAPEGGSIEVNGQSYQDPQSGETFYFLSMKDDGVGMTLAQTAHVFDRFYRGDASNTAVGGTGLGMAIVKHIIEAHGGRIWVDSTPGVGTKVSFTVPLE